jgi:hypothetical protein
LHKRRRRIVRLSTTKMKLFSSIRNATKRLTTAHNWKPAETQLIVVCWLEWWRVSLTHDLDFLNETGG